MSERKPGFYFIAMAGDDWTVAEWLEGQWFVPGTECAVEFDDSHVGPRIPTPAEDWVCVPSAPTLHQKQRGGEANCPSLTLTSAVDYAAGVYIEMLAAAPSPDDKT